MNIYRATRIAGRKGKSIARRSWLRKGHGFMITPTNSDACTVILGTEWGSQAPPKEILWPASRGWQPMLEDLAARDWVVI